MTKILAFLSLIAGIVPIILGMIPAFETPGFGAEKKKVILDSIKLFYDKIAEEYPLPISKEKLVGIASGFTDIAVAFFNVVGWFKHKNPINNS
ncbi:hypothetical protein ES705_44613 [subsurface metagenome]